MAFPVFYLLHCCVVVGLFFSLFVFVFVAVVIVVVVVFISKKNEIGICHIHALTNRNVYACMVLTCHCIFTWQPSCVESTATDRFSSRRLICLLTVFNGTFFNCFFKPIKMPTTRKYICFLKTSFTAAAAALAVFFFICLFFENATRLHVTNTHKHP